MNLAKSAFLLIIATILAKILGFAREMVLMYAYGTGVYSDIFITSMNIPTVLFAVIGSALATTFIPLYHESLEEGGEEGALKFTNNILNNVTILCIIISVLGFIFAEPLVKLFAMEFTGEKLVATVKFVRIMIGGIVFIGISNIMTSFLQIKGNFFIPGLVAVPNNIMILLSIIISSMTGNIYIMAVGGLLGMISQLLLQLPFAIKYGYKFKRTLDLKDKYVKKMIIMVAPVLVGVCVDQINTMVDRSLASGLGDGVISALNSANRLNWFVMGLFIVTLTSVIYPTLSKQSNEEDKEGFIKSVYTGINSAILLVLPVSIAAIILATPIVRILFQRGAFNDRSTLMTSTALVFYAIGMSGQGIRTILDRVFYSLKDTKTPMINSIISVTLNIVFNLKFVKIMGYGGLALATSLSFIICTILLFFSLKKKMGYFGEDKIFKTFIKSLISSFVMGIAVYMSYTTISGRLGTKFIGDATSLLVSGIVGFLVYALLIIILKVDEVKLIEHKVKNIFNKKNLVKN
ncbi:murein biosynthesis integral membrane protein MurJ [Terrisporobacter sp.]